MSKNSAFTLAEIIITLTIVGVIAATTIPTIVTNIQDYQYRTGWKKAYADLNQATTKVMQDVGGNFKYICGNWNNDCMRDKYSKYLNYIKKCDMGSGIDYSECWSQNTKYLNRLSAQGGNGTANSGFSFLDPSGLILNNGSILLFNFDYRHCDYIPSMSNIPRCGWIVIDINGNKLPNTIGKDIFLVHFLKDRITPFGTQGDGNEGSCNVSDKGYGCSALYLYQ